MESIGEVKTVERASRHRFLSAGNRCRDRENPETGLGYGLRIVDAHAVDFERLVEILVVVAAPAVLPAPGGDLPGHLLDAALRKIDALRELERLVGLIGQAQSDAADRAASRRFDLRCDRDFGEFRQGERAVEHQFDVFRFAGLPAHFDAVSGKGVVGRRTTAGDVFLDSGIQVDRERGSLKHRRNPDEKQCQERCCGKMVVFHNDL